jgi:hypothetical protein
MTSGFATPCPPAEHDRVADVDRHGPRQVLCFAARDAPADPQVHADLHLRRRQLLQMTICDGTSPCFPDATA